MVNTKKLFKTALEGVVSSSLAATMLLTQLNLGVKAANEPTKFIEKSALGSGTIYGLISGTTMQKVYFGKNGSNPQGWYIAGYDSDTQGTVLVCDPSQAMGTSVKFLASYDTIESKYYNKTAYTSEWGCDYTDGTVPTDRVNTNHYGGSDIRLITLKNCLQKTKPVLIIQAVLTNIKQQTSSIWATLGEKEAIN